MRRPSPASFLLSVLALPVVLVVPVVTPPGAASAPVPVPAELHTVPLASSASAAPAPAGAQLRTTASRRITLPARDTEDFSTLGVTWLSGAVRPDVEVFLKTRGEDGNWTDWVDLEGQTQDAPDQDARDTAGTGVREGTRPLYVGPSDGVEVRVEVLSGQAPADLRVDLIDPGSSPADLEQKRPLSVAGASEPQPFVVSRAEWGADESIKKCTSGYTGTPRVAFVHHTASTNDYAPEEGPAAVRGFYAYHVKSNGWCDIGYNLLVDRYGVVYEGRAGGIERAVLGAHTGGFNSNSFGVAMIGNFTTQMPPAALRESLRRVVAWKLGRSYADPVGTARLTAGSGSRFPSGSTQTFDVVSGHRDAVETSCPGDVGYSILQRLRADIRSEMGASFVAPSASPLTTSAGPVAVSAGLLRPLSWRLEVVSASTGVVVRSLAGQADARVETAWDLRDDAGVPVAPGTYRATLFGGPDDDPAEPWSTTVTVQAPSGSSPAPRPVATPAPAPSPTTAPAAAPTPTRAAGPAPSRSPAAVPSRPATAAPAPAPAAPASTRGSAFTALSPVRVLDTRDGTGGRRTPVGGAETMDLVLAGRSGVPADATAVALNLTATRPTSGTHLTVWPAGAPQPETAVLNLKTGATAASLVVAGLGRDGAASVRNLAGDVDLVADVVGYWSRTGGALYHPVRPARLLDTREAAGGARRVADQETQELAVRGRGGVPAGATAVVLNVTAVGPTRSGYVTVTPSGVTGSTSSVNYAAGETVPNRVVAGLSASGAVDVFAAGSTHVLVDVVGWYGPGPDGSAYTALTPSRLVDSRDGTGTPRGQLGPQTTRDVQVTGVGGVPAGATAVVVSLTGASPTASQTFVAAFPDGTALPGTSDLNLVRGQTRSNLAVVPLSSAGRMSLYNEGGSTHVIADVLGYYAAG